MSTIDRTRRTRPEKYNNERNLSSLVVPWAAIVLASIVAATCFFWESSSESSFGEEDRFLSASAGSSSSESHHVHKHVYEEVHDPLFPLSNSDKIGFACAIVGLMIAAGGGIGGGGMLVPIYILVTCFLLQQWATTNMPSRCQILQFSAAHSPT